MSDTPRKPARPFRSWLWFNDMTEPGETAVYLERYPNQGWTSQELRSGKPVIGIAQTGSDLVPCNRHHLQLAERVKAGIRDAGGIPFEFPVHPIQESCRRPTSALDRNLAYLGLVEILVGYPIDAVVLMTGCDKTTPACIMAAATTNTPAIVLSGGPMIDHYYKGQLCGSGMALWEARRMLAGGEIDADGLIEMVTTSAPSAGHCNTMGTAMSMNSLAEAMGMSLPGCASIPAPYGERGRMAYLTGRRAVEMAYEDLTPDKILTREAMENAIVACSAIGGSTNCAPHVTAIARHAGLELPVEDWERVGHEIHLLVNLQPAGKYLCESYHRAGGVPAVMGELLRAGKLRENAMTVTGKTVGENYRNSRSVDREVIKTYDEPLMRNAGFLVLRGNLCGSALLKTSVISEDFRRRFLSTPGDEEAFTSRVIVFEGPEDYRKRIDDPELAVDERCMLVIRGTGPVGYPGSAEVVNMTPPGYLVKAGTRMLPCLGDGRQSGTSDSPSILHVSPESAAGGNLAILRTGDFVRVDLKKRRIDIQISDEEIAERRRNLKLPELRNDSPWQELFRAHVGQLDTGAVLEFAVKYRRCRDVVPRHSH
jgi:dihydroxy-acid dehydratase